MTDADRLRKLYEERAPANMSQAEFGTVYGIGSKAMVWQYLSGHRPLNFEAAAKFARGLSCTIADISPEMARKLKAEIFPVLGKVSVKAAMALVGIPPLLQYAWTVCVLCKTTVHNATRKIFRSPRVEIS